MDELQADGAARDEANRLEAERAVAHDEAVVDDARRTKENALFEQGYADHVSKDGRGVAELSNDNAFEKAAIAAGHRAVQRDRLWQDTYVAKYRELDKTGWTREDREAQSEIAAGDAVAAFDDKHSPRAKMSDLAPFSAGAARARAEVAAAKTPEPATPAKPAAESPERMMIKEAKASSRTPPTLLLLQTPKRIKPSQTPKTLQKPAKTVKKPLLPPAKPEARKISPELEIAQKNVNCQKEKPEGGVGFGKKKKLAALEEAQAEVSKLINAETRGDSDAEKLQFKFATMQRVAEIQVNKSEVPGSQSAGVGYRQQEQRGSWSWI